MIQCNEVKVYTRHRFKMSVECGYFNSDSYWTAEILGFSRHVVYFESNILFKPKASILIKRTDYAVKSAGRDRYREPPLIFLAEIEWCKKNNELDVFQYKYCAKYIESRH